MVRSLDAKSLLSAGTTRAAMSSAFSVIPICMHGAQSPQPRAAECCSMHIVALLSEPKNGKFIARINMTGEDSHQMSHCSVSNPTDQSRQMRW